MTRTRAAVLAASQLALHLLLLSGAAAVLPAGARLAFAFLALVLLPGLGWLAAIGARVPGGAWMAPGWGLGLGVAWQAALVLGAHAAGAPFTSLVAPGAALSLLPWGLAAARAPRPGVREAEGAGLRGAALAAVLAAAALAAWHCATLGTPVTVYADSADHIGTIRRMLASGEAFPTDAFFRDAGPMGADPRKGLWHPVVALLCRIADVDPWPAWRMLGALVAPLFVLNAAAFAWRLGGPLPAAIGAWALLLTYGGSLTTVFLREAGLATKLADQLAVAVAAAVLADLDERGARSRIAAVALALGAVATHVFASLQFATVFGALGIGLLVRDRGAGPAFRRLFVTAAALGAACLPYLLWRTGGAYAPGNVIHTEPQGLLELANGVSVINFGVFWEWLGFGALLFPLSAWAWARASARPAALYLLTTSLAVFAIMLFPPVTMALQPKLGYLLMRFVWVLPLFAAVAFAADALARALASGGARARVAAAAWAAALALALHHPAADAVRVFADPRGYAGGREDVSGMAPLAEPLAWMDAHLPEGSVVLSDPATSYAVPMATRHWVATLVDQHSSPNDTLALVRILQARDALDPHGTWERTREVVAARGVTAIALNDRFPEVPRLDYWAPSPAWFRAARARLDSEPLAFRRVHDTGDFVVYTIDRAALETLSGGGLPRPYVTRVDAPGSFTPMGQDLPGLAAFTLSAAEASPGDTLVAVCDWVTPRPLPPGSYKVALRFDRALPADLRAPSWLAKPTRKLYESRAGERYRFRVDHLPVHGAYGPDLWRADERIADSIRVEVPGDAAAGEYEVQVKMLREPHYPNFRLADFFLDRDYYTGPAVGRLRVRPRTGG